MQTVLLPGSTTPTSRIGLGCGRLAGGPAFRTSAAVVEAALAAGIRHFDVAPPYGLGLAEGVLGQVIGDNAETTIATKAGIDAPRGGGALLTVRKYLKPLVAKLPGLRAKLGAAAAAAAPPTRGRFAPDDIRASFETSLKALRRDRVDLFLLHEPPAETPPGVEALLQELQAADRIGAYGAGANDGPETLPPLGHVAQFAWSPDATDSRFPIRHGLVRNWLPRLPAALPTDPADRRAMADQLGFDLDDPLVGPSLLLTVALSLDPDGMMLVSSENPARITRIVDGVDWAAVRGERPAFAPARDRLISALKREAGRVQP